MHDWTLLKISVNWPESRIVATFKNSRSLEVELTGEGLTDLHVPKIEAWGRSVSVNKLEGPKKTNEGLQKIAIEMQSGDVIEIVARSIALPKESS